MKITIDITSIQYGTGVSRYTSNLVRHLPNHLGKDDQLILFGTSVRNYVTLVEFAKSIPNAKKVILPIPPSTAATVFGNVLNIENVVGKTDIVHAWDWYVPKTTANVTVTVHDLALFKHPSVAHGKIAAQHKKVIESLIKNQSRVITVSNATKSDLINIWNYPNELIEVIYEALPLESKIDPQDDDLKWAANISKKPFILIVGTNEPRKNIPAMINAWIQHSNTHDLVLAGKKGWESIPVIEGLHNLGYIEPERLAALYRKADLLAYCSIEEGFGLPILEAFYHGCPVVTSQNSAMLEVAGEAAALVDPHDVTSISDGFQKALVDRDELIKKGAKRLNEFSWDKAARATYQHYQSVHG